MPHVITALIEDEEPIARFEIYELNPGVCFTPAEYLCHTMPIYRKLGSNDLSTNAPFAELIDAAFDLSSNHVICIDMRRGTLVVLDSGMYVRPITIELKVGAVIDPVKYISE